MNKVNLKEIEEMLQNEIFKSQEIEAECRDEIRKYQRKLEEAENGRKRFENLRERISYQLAQTEKTKELARKAQEKNSELGLW